MNDLTPQTYPVCSHCGSDDIELDVLGRWDKTTHTVETEIMDKGHYCCQCEGECYVDWRSDNAERSPDNVKMSFLAELPSYASHLNFQEENEGRSMGIVSLTPHETLSERITKMLAEFHCGNQVVIRGHSWSSPAMIGAMNYSFTDESGADLQLSCYFEIAHLY